MTEQSMRQTILLADDSPTIRRLVTHTFADADFKIVEVSNGDAAIKIFEETKPHLVMADIYMPGKNGYEVCTYVRHHPALNATPVILLVGAFDAFDEERAKRSGATANITKPFEPGALIDLVKSVLRSAMEEETAAPELVPAPAPPQPVAAPFEVPPPVPAPAPPVAASVESSPAAATEDDLLGLGSIFQEEPAVQPARSMSDEEIDRIADRVIQRLSTQVIESIAWDIVPDITHKILREELKRIDES
jgi:CheY-like chemotaxis protein